MPTYEYQCEKCEHYFTRNVSISSMYAPEGEPCANCGEVAVKKVILTAPTLGDPVRLGIRRPDNGFKEVLQKIHDKAPGSTLKSHSSFI